MEDVQSYPAFKYRPLKDAQHTRLIKVHPARTPDDLVQISFLAIDLAQAPPYHALSYTWGDTYPDGSHLTHTILCEGHQLRVTSNLHAFLLRFRSKRSRMKRVRKIGPGVKLENTYVDPVSALPIWIDALSINQDDASERGHQVADMAKIYERSISLIIWLGEVKVPHVIGWPFSDDGDDDAMVRRLLGDPGPAEYALLEQMVKHSWFQRRWVIQEVLHTKRDVRCFWIADLEVSWNSVAEAATWIVSPLLRNTASFTAGQYLKNTLLENLTFWDYSECSDDRDRIYALLSISEDGEALDVDYSKDTESIYWQVAVHVATSQTSVLDFLPALLACAVSHPQDSLRLTMPSWVPDWRNVRSLMTPREEDCIQRCIATAPSPNLIFKEVRQDGYLHIRGWLISDRCESFKGVHQAFAKLKSLVGMHRGCLCIGCVGIWLEERVFLTDIVRPPISAGQSLCLIEGSSTAFVLSNSYEHTLDGVAIYHLDDCFSVAQLDVRWDSDLYDRLGRAKDIYLG